MATCDFCHKEIPEGKSVLLVGKNNAMAISCQSCSAQAPVSPKVIKIPNQKLFHADPRFISAMIFSFIFALIGGYVWFRFMIGTKMLIGFVAIGIGFVIAQVTIVASGDTRGLKVQIISGLATIFAMAFGEYLFGRHVLMEYITQKGYSEIPLLDSIRATFEIMYINIKNNATVFFWLFAVTEAIIIPRKKKTINL
jgi:hypothetical protein